MNRQALNDLLTAGESQSVEFKTSLADSRKIIETAAAMTTRGGGTILIGVRDDGTTTGANIGDGEIERLTQQMLAHTDPRIFVSIDELVVAGKRLLRISVPPGDGPHLAFGRAFHRVGRATVAMSRDEYERGLLDRLRESSGFERRTLDDVTIDDLDPAAVANWVRHARARLKELPRQPSASEVVQRLHFGAGPSITIAGCLMFSAEPEGPLPQATIRALSQRGAAQDNHAIGGPLCTQIDEAFSFVERNLKTSLRKAGARRIDVPELPLDAVREVIANAVAHRDYRSTAATQLRIDDAALTVWNPGAFVAPITPALLHQVHPSVPPNPLLARALYLAGYIEEWGTGTLNVIESMRAHIGVEPIFEAAPGGIKVTLPMRKGSALLGGRANDALKGFVRGKAFRAAEYAARANVSLRTAAADLKTLERRGLVQQTGVGRSTRWVRS